jgi:hypothetical protein
MIQFFKKLFKRDRIEKEIQFETIVTAWWFNYGHQNKWVHIINYRYELGISYEATTYGKGFLNNYNLTYKQIATIYKLVHGIQN